MGDPLCSAAEGIAEVDGPLHQQQRRDAARSAQLEPQRVHARRHRADVRGGRLRRRKLLLKSVNIDLPNGDRMFEGPGSDAANNNCLACHSAGMVLNQPALSKAQWRTEVEKMRTAYKAPIDPKDVDGIVDYLAGMKIVR